MNKDQFTRSVIEVAKKQGYDLETNRQGLRQIDFGQKKLHEGHLAALYPEILQPDANIPSLIERVAPGRPCAHRPMRNIIEEIVDK